MNNSVYQELSEHLQDEHGLILLDSEIQEIIRLGNKLSTTKVSDEEILLKYPLYSKNGMPLLDNAKSREAAKWMRDKHL